MICFSVILFRFVIDVSLTICFLCLDLFCFDCYLQVFLSDLFVVCAVYVLLVFLFNVSNAIGEYHLCLAIYFCVCCFCHILRVFLWCHMLVRQFNLVCLESCVLLCVMLICFVDSRLRYMRFARDSIVLHCLSL